MATLRAETARHRHTDKSVETLTNLYIILPNPQVHTIGKGVGSTYANSPGYGTNLPFSRTGHQISWIKATLIFSLQ